MATIGHIIRVLVNCAGYVRFGRDSSSDLVEWHFSLFFQASIGISAAIFCPGR